MVRLPRSLTGPATLLTLQRFFTQELACRTIRENAVHSEAPNAETFTETHENVFNTETF